MLHEWLAEKCIKQKKQEEKLYLHVDDCFSPSSKFNWFATADKKLIHFNKRGMRLRWNRIFHHKKEVSNSFKKLQEYSQALNFHLLFWKDE